MDSDSLSDSEATVTARLDHSKVSKVLMKMVKLDDSSMQNSYSNPSVQRASSNMLLEKRTGVMTDIYLSYNFGKE